MADDVSERSAEAAYTLEYPVICPHCGEELEELKVVRLLRFARELHLHVAAPRAGDHLPGLSQDPHGGAGRLRVAAFHGCRPSAIMVRHVDEDDAGPPEEGAEEDRGDRSRSVLRRVRLFDLSGRPARWRTASSRSPTRTGAWSAPSASTPASAADCASPWGTPPRRSRATSAVLLTTTPSTWSAYDDVVKALESAGDERPEAAEPIGI